jgi:hypothetical protein
MPLLKGDYYVQVSLNGCSSAFSDTINFFGTAVSNNQISDWNVYPIPTSGAITIKANLGDRAATSIIITDLEGRRMKQVELGHREGDNTLSVDLSDLSDGIYLLQLVQGDRFEVKRIAVNK